MDKMRILAIDDNTVNLATLEQELKSKYEVIPMISGRRAIKYLYREQVDLILLDVDMPLMDGVETLKEIRTQENGVTVPVIFLTAKKDKATVLDGVRLGIMDYITKPFDPKDLHERIERVFRRMGVLPMEEEELYKRIVEILKDMKKDHIKQAALKVEEVLNYQIEEEISGRIRNVLSKLRQSDIDGAIVMVERVVEYLDSKLATSKKTTSLPIAQNEIPARILFAIEDLKKFKRVEAIKKLKDLQKYDITHYVYSVINQAITLLEDYDDVSAEEILRGLYNELKGGIAPASSGTDTKNEMPTAEQLARVGYHSSFNKERE